MRAEGGLDRFFKWLGVAEEFQSGDSGFDRSIYIVSDDKRIHQLLASSESPRKTILSLLENEVHGCQFKELRCNSGRLWVRYKPPKDLSHERVTVIGEEVQPRLKVAADALVSSPYTAISAWRDPFVLKAAVILAISTGLAVNGITHFVRLIYTPIPSTLTIEPLFIDALILGAIMVAVLVASAILALGRSARTHWVLIEVLLAGSFGAVSTAFAELRDANMEFDTSPATTVELVAMSKRYSRHRRGPDRYYIRVRNWHDQHRESIELAVSGGLYAHVRTGDRIRAFEKQGYLNYRWIEKVEKMVGSGSREISSWDHTRKLNSADGVPCGIPVRVIAGGRQVNPRKSVG